eukprot:EC691660.1.p4 GENE.EC691660.1~~EC691660.1.p4  ORF type:complete len:53 (-),score=10.46 EC691660.1:162-320(-)
MSAKLVIASQLDVGMSAKDTTSLERVRLVLEKENRSHTKQPMKVKMISRDST